jgi:TetR/AcrR family transcriptional regulator, transcriptional repressor for nem operon
MFRRVNEQPRQDAAARGARTKLLDAAISLIRERGYAATSVEDVCAKAGVTKGAFFHHFPTKDSIAIAAMDRWTELSDTLFAAAPYHRFADPLDRVLGYIDFRKAMLCGAVLQFSCLAGTMVQEAYETHPHIRRACDASLSGHVAALESDIAAAIKLHRIKAPWTPESLALHMQAVLQGAFILAKMKDRAEVATAIVGHLHRYIELLFRPERHKTVRKNRAP